MRVLGIETSCDETAAAVVEDGRHIRSNVVAAQVELHAQYGGVFPEMASREHVAKIVPVVEQAMAQAGIQWADLDAIAVTHGPGLAGSLLVGVNMAKGLALANGLPLVGVNHLEGHIYASWLASAEEPQFPLLCLIVSGGHTELILMRDHGQYELLGATLDDAAGEAFDKVARLLGLGYPGGPAIQKTAEQGDVSKLRLPRAWLEGTYNFSFSGLKTAVLNLVKQDGLRAGDSRLPVGDIAAAFQESVVDVLVEKTRLAAEQFAVKQVLIGGGVAANQRLRERMRERMPAPVLIPPVALCTDNGAVIASAGYFHFAKGERSGWDLDVVPGLRLADDE
ncbi:MAG: tRNA (adenosine(37)-N6)-threonylcarbamoyltransferase complex transferase subunit TsaD [Chloroflexi bacterium]|nr:tRNA (adenosine(37)-N6)-threonylcarbamoyltransferase complex transferase subunit TsaD [Chloroflexota bacterium]